MQQVTIRLPEGAIEAAEELVEALSEPALPVMRADVMRLALARGLAVLREENASKMRKRKRT
jgi:hypothetical protein